MLQRYIYQTKLDKACFQYNSSYGDFKNLPRRTASEKELRNKAFNVAKYLKYYGYQRRIASIVDNFFDKKTSGSTVKSDFMPKQKLAAELHKPIIKKFKKRKAHSSFIDNICWSS